MRILNRASFTIGHVFVAGASFKRQFETGFPANEVIVRQVQYGRCTNDVNLSVIQTDLVSNGDGMIANVYPNSLAGVPGYPSAMSVCPNSHFVIAPNKQNGSAVKFSILNPVTKETNILADGQLQITLEFLQVEY